MIRGRQNKLVMKFWNVSGTDEESAIGVRACACACACLCVCLRERERKGKKTQNFEKKKNSRIAQKELDKRVNYTLTNT